MCAAHPTPTPWGVDAMPQAGPPGGGRSKHQQSRLTGGGVWGWHRPAAVFECCSAWIVGSGVGLLCSSSGASRTSCAALCTSDFILAARPNVSTPRAEPHQSRLRGSPRPPGLRWALQPPTIEPPQIHLQGRSCSAAPPLTTQSPPYGHKPPVSRQSVHMHVVATAYRH